MPKYLWRASYTAQGTRGLVKAGGSKRKKAVEAALRTVGGKLEAFYFALGEVDVYIIADVPDNVSIAALSLVINAAGAVSVNTTALMTPEELDQAADAGDHQEHQQGQPVDQEFEYHSGRNSHFLDVEGILAFNHLAGI